MSKKKNNKQPEGGGDDETYTVGYRKPPKDNRFKKGCSGNPNGRPRATKNLRTVLREELQQPIRITENGKSRSVATQQALFITLKARGLRGDSKATLAILAMAERLLPTEEEVAARSHDLSPQEREVLDAMRSRLGLADSVSTLGTDSTSNDNATNASPSSDEGKDEE